MKYLELNGVSYRWPQQPVVVVCIDGGDPAYIEQGLKDGIIPNIARFMREGFSAVADGTVPSFTCPNNMSLIGSPWASADRSPALLDPLAARPNAAFLRA